MAGDASDDDDDAIVITGETAGDAAGREDVVVTGETAPSGVGSKRPRSGGRSRHDVFAENLNVGTLFNANPNPTRTTPPDVNVDPPAFRLWSTEGVTADANAGCVSISDVVRGSVRWAIVMNFTVDLDWFLAACPALRTARRVILMYGNMHPGVAEIPKHWSTHKPPCPQYGTHHTKAFILAYDAGVRVVIHTANLTHHDFNKSCQAVWYQDFPLKRESSPPGSAFENDLVRYVSRLQWSGESVDGERVSPEALRYVLYTGPHTTALAW